MVAMFRRRFFSRSSLGAATAVLVFFSACANAPVDGADESAISSVPNSRVKNQQQTGDCVLYTTLAWIESLTADPTKSFVGSYSPSYLSYWLWFDHILSRYDADGTRPPTYGYKPYVVRDIVARYGLLQDGAFVYGEDAVATAKALAYVTAAYKPGGKLSRPEDRKNPRTVRAVLDAAFELELREGLVQGMNAAFGADGSKRFDVGGNGKSYSQNGVTIVNPAQLVARIKPASGTNVVRLANVLGDPDAVNYATSRARNGAAVWREFYLYQSAGTTSPEVAPLTRRIQRALNDDLPLPMTWSVYPASYVASLNRYAGPISNDPSTELGAYASLFVDYQVDNVPGFGTLFAGAAATSEQRAAALDARSKVAFFRIKNSWGTVNAPSTVPKNFQAGYYDLAYDFLFQPVRQTIPGSTSEGGTLQGFTSVLLPPGY